MNPSALTTPCLTATNEPSESLTPQTLTPPLKWFGGKHYLASRIVSLMPKHLHYVEPFFGGGAVLLSKPYEGISEVVNDKHQELTNFWRVLQQESLFTQFQRIVECIPFSETEWKDAGRELGGSAVERAVRFFVRCRQSRVGQMQDFATLSRTRTRRGRNEQVSAWMSAVDGLPQVSARLKRVVVMNGDAVDLILGQDGAQTLYYCDPPYLHETRTCPGAYAHEMTEEDHRELLRILDNVEGKVMLSGYFSPLYDSTLKAPKWHRVDFDIANHAAGGSSKRRMVESLWLNYDPATVTNEL
jgi:DNA adenine methylase